MAHQVKWTERIIKEFVSKAVLSEEEEYIIKSRARGVSVVQQAIHLCKSESSVARMIALLKKKYDVVQKEYPDVFPKRTNGAKETWKV